ncbi:hypothetical protein LV84_02141 [Algoriphagus ratkowskyi]|uniref:Uncharacterized protein n=1 Tax=Algoriphagus ratkowskyi TaxID=57028 RepID=A0A2W7RF45_9BACT|nr:hypothetical protein [Algoriphagus ratkowskyi]PZX57010.1 hypothetical protein LV84_02141 [Algoriphagus ratkowskyi]
MDIRKKGIYLFPVNGPNIYESVRETYFGKVKEMREKNLYELS